MSFLAPAFLLGAAAVAVPILIHLVHRERRQTQVFPSLMFLRQVPHRSVRRRRVRHWLLLAMRCAGLVLLALAFARPVLTDVAPSPGPEGGARAVVVLLDRSYSMGYADRWPRAVAAAREVLEGLGDDDVSGLVYFGDTAQASGTLTSDHGALAATLRVSDAKLSWEGTRFAPALKVAVRLLEEAGPEVKELVVVSDFQKRGLDDVEDVALPRGAEVRWVNLSEDEASNRGITEVTLQRVYDRDRERVAVAARVVAQGRSHTGPTTASFELNGRVVQTRPVDLAGEGVVTVRFDPVLFPQTSQRGVVRLEADALPQDDVFRFLLEPGRGVGVLVIEREGARRGESLFLRRALAIGDRPRFEVRSRRVSAVQVGDLERVGVVLLNDAPWPSGGVGQAVLRFVDEGGGVVAALGARTDPRRWTGPAEALLPGPLEPRPVDRSGDWSGTLASLDYDHPVFELFSRPRSGDFSEARFMRYRSLGADRGTVLARFDDGSPALVEVSRGEGRLLFWTSSLDTLWNDLPLQPVFLPFVHRLVAHAATHTETPAWRQVGDVLELPEATSDEWIGTIPDGSRARLEPEERFFSLNEAGFYELRPSSQDETIAPLTVAVNADPAESDLSFADPEEFAGGLARGGAGGAAGPALSRPGEAEERQRLWWFLLMAALWVLAAETILSNHLSREVR